MFWTRRATIDADEREWISQCWLWLDTLLGPVCSEPPRELILPGRGHFPDTNKLGHEKALYYFNLTKSYCGLEDEAVDLVAQPERMGLQGNSVFAMQSRSDTAGTYSRTSNTAIVTYDPALLDHPTKLIATFAHELAHELITSYEADTPGGVELHELATEIAVAHLGFGLFGANAAFEFKPIIDVGGQGWSSSRGGYLSEAMWSYANALFMELRDIPEDGYSSFAKANISRMIARNRKFLQVNPDIVGQLRSSS